MQNCPSGNAKNSIEKNSSVEKKVETVCPKCLGLYIVNKKSGEMFPASCKTYSCTHCGEKQKQRLFKFLYKYVQTFEHVTMFTFTFRASLFENYTQQEKVKLSSECWRRFLIYFKRNKNTTNKTKNFKYVKVTEFHLSGNVHYHAIIDRFFPLSVANYSFWQAINSVFHTTGKHGNIDMSRSSGNQKMCVKYLVKYVSKGAKLAMSNLKYRRWSKNGKGSIFPPKISNPDFVFYNGRNLSIDLDSERLTSQENPENFSILDIIDFDFIEKPPYIEELDDFTYPNC